MAPHSVAKRLKVISVTIDILSAVAGKLLQILFFFSLCCSGKSCLKLLGERAADPSSLTNLKHGLDTSEYAMLFTTQLQAPSGAPETPLEVSLNMG